MQDSLHYTKCLFIFKDSITAISADVEWYISDQAPKMIWDPWLIKYTVAEETFAQDYAKIWIAIAEPVKFTSAV